MHRQRQARMRWARSLPSIAIVSGFAPMAVGRGWMRGSAGALFAPHGAPKTISQSANTKRREDVETPVPERC